MIATTSRPAPLAAPADHPVLRGLLSRSYPVVMGVLNITPDSFYDGGKFVEPDRALAQARQMIADGADIIDIGAESTRPYGGMEPVAADHELARLKPILPAVVALGTPVSIDSMKAEIARFALQNGAAVINDVWGLQRDGGMADLAAEFGVPVIVMHNRAAVDPDLDIMTDIEAFFARSLEIAAKAGIRRENVVLDPGIGFGKTAEQSLVVLARLPELHAFGCALLVGASRKSFIASVMPAKEAEKASERLGGSIAAHVLAAQGGARIIRTHDVAETVQAMRVFRAIEDRR